MKNKSVQSKKKQIQGYKKVRCYDVDQQPRFFRNGFTYASLYKGVRAQEFECKFQASFILKERGNGLFKLGLFTDAARNFEMALTVFLFIEKIYYDNAQDHDYYFVEYFGQSTTESNLVKDHKLKLFVNLAACYLKELLFLDALKACDIALTADANSVKAYYRRAIARQQLEPDAIDNAIADLDRAYHLDPKNDEIKKEIIKIKALQQSRKKTIPHIQQVKKQVIMEQVRKEPNPPTEPLRKGIISIEIQVEKQQVREEIQIEIQIENKGQGKRSNNQPSKDPGKVSSLNDILIEPLQQSLKDRLNECFEKSFNDSSKEFSWEIIQDEDKQSYNLIQNPVKEQIKVVQQESCEKQPITQKNPSFQEQSTICYTQLSSSSSSESEDCPMTNEKASKFWQQFNIHKDYENFNFELSYEEDTTREVPIEVYELGQFIELRGQEMLLALQTQSKMKEAEILKEKLAKAISAKAQLQKISRLDFTRPKQHLQEIANKFGIDLLQDCVKDEFLRIQQQNILDIRQWLKQNQWNQPKTIQINQKDSKKQKIKPFEKFILTQPISKPIKPIKPIHQPIQPIQTTKIIIQDEQTPQLQLQGQGGQIDLLSLYEEEKQKQKEQEQFKEKQKDKDKDLQEVKMGEILAEITKNETKCKSEEKREEIEIKIQKREEIEIEKVKEIEIEIVNQPVECQNTTQVEQEESQIQTRKINYVLIFVVPLAISTFLGIKLAYFY